MEENEYWEVYSQDSERSPNHYNGGNSRDAGTTWAQTKKFTAKKKSPPEGCNSKPWEKRGVDGSNTENKVKDL